MSRDNFASNMQTVSLDFSTFVSVSQSRLFIVCIALQALSMTRSTTFSVHNARLAFRNYLLSGSLQ